MDMTEREQLPNHLDREKIEQYAREATTVYEFTRQARVGRKTAKGLLHKYGLYDEVEAAHVNRISSGD